MSAGGGPRDTKSYWAALDAISSKLRVTRVPNTSILEVTATSPNPREARDLANATAEAYREFNKSLRNSRVTEARRFIENQLKDVETRARRTEAEIWAFREANRIIVPGAESSVLLSVFTQVRGDIEKTRQQRIELEAIQQRLSRVEPTSRPDRIFIETTNPAMQRLQTTYSELLLERNSLAIQTPQRVKAAQAPSRARKILQTGDAIFATVRPTPAIRRRRWPARSVSRSRGRESMMGCGSRTP